MNKTRRQSNCPYANTKKLTVAGSAVGISILLMSSGANGAVSRRMATSYERSAALCLPAVNSDTPRAFAALALQTNNTHTCHSNRPHENIHKNKKTDL